MTPPLILVVGPTGSGKSALAMELAARLNGQIVSADSMQIYRGCDIATAKPTLEDRRRVPHHLLDICDPDERYSAGQFAQDALNCISHIRLQGQVPIVCGGTGFYFRALVHPEKIPAGAANLELRHQLESQLAQEGNLAMHQHLAQLSPGAASRIHPNDSYRVLRAMEIALSPQEPPQQTSSQGPEFDSQAPNFLAVALQWPREILYQRLEQRVEQMLADGALKETESLLGIWGETAPALAGVGYKELVPVLRGQLGMKEALELWRRDTRRYAKRQLTWFRHQLQTHWLDAERPLDILVEQTLALLNDGSKPGAQDSRTT